MMWEGSVWEVQCVMWEGSVSAVGRCSEQIWCLRAGRGRADAAMCAERDGCQPLIGSNGHISCLIAVTDGSGRAGVQKGGSAPVTARPLCGAATVPAQRP